MPVSKHRPDPRLIRNFRERAGDDRQVDALDERIDNTQKQRTTDLKARRAAKTAAMVSGGLCKSVR